MLDDLTLHARQTGVNDFHGAPIEYLAGLVVLREVFVYEFQELFSYIYGKEFAERRIEPYDIPFPVSRLLRPHFSRGFN